MSDIFNIINKVVDKDSFRTVKDEFADSGCYPINLLLSGRIKGGVPKSGVTMFAGDSGYGKTFIALSAVKNFMKDGYTVIWIDAEFAINKDIIENFGLQQYIDNKQFILLGETNIAKIKNYIVSIIENIDMEDKIAFVIDSYAAMITTKVVDDSIKGKEVVDMQTTKKKNELMTIVNGLAAKKRIPVIIINHVYLDPNSMFPKTIISGGTKARYFSNSILLMNSKAKVKNNNGDIVGANVTSITDKSRFAKENSKLKFHINYSKGLDPYFGLLELFLDIGLIVKDGKKYYSIENPNKKYWEKDLYCAEVFEPLIEKYSDKIDEVFKYVPIDGDAVLSEIDELIDNDN